jgi:hypothetical protein
MTENTKQTVNSSMTASEENGDDNNTFAMFIVAGMVMSAAGFTMYTKQAGSLLKAINRASELQGMSKSSTAAAAAVAKKKPGNISKEEWDRIRPRHDKDDIF